MSKDNTSKLQNSSSVTSLRRPKLLHHHDVAKQRPEFGQNTEEHYDTEWVRRECEWFDRRLNMEPEPAILHPIKPKVPSSSLRGLLNKGNSRKSSLSNFKARQI